MKTVAPLIVFLCFINIKIFAKNTDSSAFNLGKIILSAGYGYPNLDKDAFAQNFINSYNPNYTFKSTGYGPFHFRAEYGLSKKIGIGVSFNYNTYKANWNLDVTIYGNGSTQYYIYEYQKEASSVSFHYSTS